MLRLILFLAIFALSCSPSEQRTLNLYTSLDAQEAPVYIRAFEEETGIRVQWTRLSAGEALARLEVEKHNPQVSVWFGGPSPEYIVAGQRGLLDPFDGELWTGFYFGAIGFACNENFLRINNAVCPDSWSGLLDPKFKGQISLAYPYTSGTAYVLVVALLELMGEQAGWDYIRKLDTQVHHYNSSGSAAVTQAGLGEVGLGIAFAHDILKKGRERGYPVALSVPKDGSPVEIGAVALVKGGKHLDEGREFIAWLLSEEAQNLLAEFYRVPLNPNARVAEGAIRASDIKAIEFDALAAATNQKQILAKWREITGR